MSICSSHTELLIANGIIPQLTKEEVAEMLAAEKRKKQQEEQEREKSEALARLEVSFVSFCFMLASTGRWLILMSCD